MNKHVIQPLIPLPFTPFEWNSELPPPRYSGKMLPLVVAALGYFGDRRWISMCRTAVGLQIDDGSNRVLHYDDAGDTPITRFAQMLESFPFAEGVRGYRLIDDECGPEYLDRLLIDRGTGDLYVLPRELSDQILLERAAETIPCEVDLPGIGELFRAWLQGQRELFEPLYAEP